MCVENPLAVKRFISSLTLRSTKTDSADALSIARYGLFNYDRLRRKDDTIDEVNKTIARRRQEVAEDMARAKTQLKCDLAKGWPEILQLNVFTDTMLDILYEYGGPAAISAASESKLDSFIAGRPGRKADISGCLLKELARDSIGVPFMETLVKDSMGKLRDIMKKSRKLTEALLAYEKEVHKKEMEILTSFPGDDIRRFPTYQKLIAFVGTDPSIYQSGNYAASGRIIKHGDRSLRKYVFLMAQKSIACNPVLKQYYEKKIAQGFSYRKTIVAVMNKLLKLIHALLTSGEKFEIRCS